jgi:hypothetical protein
MPAVFLFVASGLHAHCAARVANKFENVGILSYRRGLRFSFWLLLRLAGETRFLIEKKPGFWPGGYYYWEQNHVESNRPIAAGARV